MQDTCYPLHKAAIYIYIYLVSGHLVPSQGHQIIMTSKCLLLHVLEFHTQSKTPSLAVTCQSSFSAKNVFFQSFTQLDATDLFTDCYFFVLAWTTSVIQCDVTDNSF